MPWLLRSALAHHQTTPPDPSTESSCPSRLCSHPPGSQLSRELQRACTQPYRHRGFTPHRVRFCRDPTLSWLSAPGQAASSERIPGGTVPHGTSSRALRGRVSSLYRPCYPAPRRNRRNGLKKASKKTDVEFCTCQAKNQPPPDLPCRSSLLALNPREQTGWNKDPSPSLPSLLLPQRPGSEAGHVS